MLNKLGVLLCIFNSISHQAAANTQCREFTVDIVDMKDFSNYKPINNSITSLVHTELSGCEYLRVYLELEQPVAGLTFASANFTLLVGDKSVALTQENHVIGLTAGIILALIFFTLVAYFGYNLLMEKLKSGVYRIPPTTETMQFEAL